MVDIFLSLGSAVGATTRSIALGISAMKNTATGSGPRLRPMISIAELLERIPISRTTLDKMVKEGTFPRPYPITPTKFGFFLDDVITWQQQLVRESSTFRNEN
jgi:predicted DNA-binding transcriptional regulator AlpA